MEGFLAFALALATLFSVLAVALKTSKSGPTHTKGREAPNRKEPPKAISLTQNHENREIQHAKLESTAQLEKYINLKSENTQLRAAKLQLEQALREEKDRLERKSALLQLASEKAIKQTERIKFLESEISRIKLGLKNQSATTTTKEQLAIKHLIAENVDLSRDLSRALKKIDALKKNKFTNTAKKDNWPSGDPGTPIKGSNWFRGYCKVCGDPIAVCKAEDALLMDCGCYRRPPSRPALS